MNKRYAERGKEKRVTVSWVLPARLKNYVAMIAKHTQRSESMVASELIEAAINGEIVPATPESSAT